MEFGVWGWGWGLGVQGFGFQVQGSGFRVQGSGFRVQGSGFRVQGSGHTRGAAEDRLIIEEELAIIQRVDEGGVVRGECRHVAAHGGARQRRLERAPGVGFRV